jgi:hypothetical protein
VHISCVSERNPTSFANPRFPSRQPKNPTIATTAGALYSPSVVPLFSRTFTSTRRFSARPCESVFSAAG